jgi:hypothetical protein
VRLGVVAIALLLARTAAAAPEPAPVFEVAIGGNGVLAGEDENLALLPVGGAPASFAVDAERRWWILDAIGARVLVLGTGGTLVRSVPFPLAGPGKDKRTTTFRSDVELDGHGGFFTVDATAHRIEHWTFDGKREWTAGSEKLPKGQGGLDLPQRVERIGTTLFVSDRGSERVVRFDADTGQFMGTSPNDHSVPLPGGGFAIFSEDSENSSGSLVMTAKGGHGRPVTRIAAADGATLDGVALVGATAEGDAVLAIAETGASNTKRVRIVLYDRAGLIRGETAIAAPGDEATPVRRFRLTPAGTLAWFRVRDGRFQAFEMPLPSRSAAAP